MSGLLKLLDLPREEKEARGLLYTPQEIAQQPATWRTTLRYFEENHQRIRSFLEEAGVASQLEQRPTVVLTGAGTSDYIGQSLILLMRQRWGCEVLAIASPDLLSSLEDYVVPGRRYLWISFSRSGDSPEGVAVLEQALDRFPEVSHVVVTCNPRSRMFDIGERHERVLVAVLDDSVNDRGLAMTSSFTNMVVFGQCLAHAWSMEEYAPVLDAMVPAGEAFLKSASQMAAMLAERRFARMCFVGSGALAAVARESGLKVLEMSAGRVKTMFETVLGLRHGPMAALDAGTLFVCFVSAEQRRQQYEIDLLREIETKEIVEASLAIGPESARASVAPAADHYLSISGEIADVYRPPIDVIFGQLLGLYCSLEHGMKPDAPSPGGVISRVVQDFRIYP